MGREHSGLQLKVETRDAHLVYAGYAGTDDDQLENEMVMKMEPVLALLPFAKFRKMEDRDYDAFAGAGDKAVIADNEELGDHVLIIDEKIISLIDGEGTETIFTLKRFN